MKNILARYIHIFLITSLTLTAVFYLPISAFAMFFLGMATTAVLQGKNPLYFGLKKAVVEKSSVIKFGLPLLGVLSLAPLVLLI